MNLSLLKLVEGKLGNLNLFRQAMIKNLEILAVQERVILLLSNT